MEYMQCGDLGEFMKDEHLSEKDVKSITGQLLDGLSVMHQHGFCHRDLKPENVFIATWMPLVVKIGDFGISKQLVDGTQLRTTAGSPLYMAPEIWGYLDSSSDTSNYTYAVDIWALGCLVQAMITKETPFLDHRPLIEYVQGKSPFPGVKLSNKASTIVVQFIISLMMPQPQDRPTAEKARQHQWLQPEPDNETIWGDDISSMPEAAEVSIQDHSDTIVTESSQVASREISERISNDKPQPQDRLTSERVRQYKSLQPESGNETSWGDGPSSMPEAAALSIQDHSDTIVTESSRMPSTEIDERISDDKMLADNSIGDSEPFQPPIQEKPELDSMRLGNAQPSLLDKPVVLNPMKPEISPMDKGVSSSKVGPSNSLTLTGYLWCRPHRGSCRWPPPSCPADARQRSKC